MTETIATSEAGGFRRRSQVRLGRLMLQLGTVMAVAALLIGAGFMAFAVDIADSSVPVDPHADGIVVVTGGSDRIDSGLQLLSEGRAARLLISGVNPQVTRRELAGAVDQRMRDLLLCCSDLGRDARDTIGNASEARSWAANKGFTSLIVVTNDYHMPRTMAELESAMPGAVLVPYPVHRRSLAWWFHDRDGMARLFGEYMKYVATRVRIALSLPPARPVTVASRTGS